MSALTYDDRPDLRVVPTRQRSRPAVGRRSGVQAKPLRPLAPPSLRVAAAPVPKACSVAAAPPIREVGWRLTERGLAAVLVVLGMIVVAALMVVGLTAVRVTGPSYQPASSMAVAQR